MDQEQELARDDTQEQDSKEEEGPRDKEDQDQGDQQHNEETVICQGDDIDDETP